MMLLLLLLLLPLSAFAQSVPSNQNQNVVVIPNALGASVWKPDLSSIDIVGTQPNNQMYFSHDRYGRNNGYGFINQPFVDRPLDATTLSPHNYSGYLPLPELPRQ
jgi:hypothetical protein